MIQLDEKRVVTKWNVKIKIKENRRALWERSHIFLPFIKLLRIIKESAIKNSYVIILYIKDEYYEIL